MVHLKLIGLCVDGEWGFGLTKGIISHETGVILTWALLQTKAEPCHYASIRDAVEHARWLFPPQSGRPGFALEAEAGIARELLT